MQVEIQDGLVTVAEAGPASLDILIIDAGSGDASQVCLCQKQTATKKTAPSGRATERGRKRKVQRMWRCWREGRALQSWHEVEMAEHIEPHGLVAMLCALRSCCKPSCSS